MVEIRVGRLSGWEMTH